MVTEINIEISPIAKSQAKNAALIIIKELHLGMKPNLEISDSVSLPGIHLGLIDETRGITERPRKILIPVSFAKLLDLESHPEIDETWAEASLAGILKIFKGDPQVEHQLLEKISNEHGSCLAFLKKTIEIAKS